jgi:hypothetical protein
MAGLAAVLVALARLSGREIGALGSLAANNFFLAGALLLSGAGSFLWLLTALLLLFPLSADPLSHAPAGRFLLWPFSRRQRILLRLASLALSPPAWLALALIVYAAPSLALAFIAFVAAIQTLRAWSTHRPHLNPLRFLPASSLPRKNLRQLFLHLDTWLALLIAACGFFTRQPEALVALTALAMLAFSTPANCLFALDAPTGLTRYQLFPVSALRVLAAKNLAYLLLACLIALPLAPLPALASAATALAFGNYFSVRYRRPQRPWRFTAGAALPGLLQSAALVATGVAAARSSPWYLVAAFTAWAVSLLWSGWWLEKTWRGETRHRSA